MNNNTIVTDNDRPRSVSPLSSCSTSADEHSHSSACSPVSASATVDTKPAHQPTGTVKTGSRRSQGKREKFVRKKTGCE
jgi:hypothetical protein